MKDEAEFNRIVANSLKASKTVINDKEVTGWGYKISDAAGAYLMATIKSPFDGFGILAKNGQVYNVYFESKFNKSLSAINLNRIEPHQMESLLATSITPSSLSLFCLGLNGEKRGDNRAYIFDVSAVSELYYEGFSIHKKFLEQLPYNEIHKGIFSFDNIITRSELYKIIGR